MTNVVEHTFCKRFTYYTLILGLKQYEEKRGTVLAGRALHKKHELKNKAYAPADLKGKKLVGLYLRSKLFNFVGRIDEVVDIGQEIVLIERKYSDRSIIWATLKVQLGLLALLVEENFGKPVLRAKVIFSKKDRIEIEVLIDSAIRSFALKMLKETMETVVSGKEPKERPDRRCLNCCFRKVCPVGSLYRP